MDKKPKQRIVGIRLDLSVFERFENLAVADDRKVASYCKRILLEQLPIRESAALTTPPATGCSPERSPTKPAVPGRSRLPKGKTGISKDDRS